MKKKKKKKKKNPHITTTDIATTVTKDGDIVLTIPGAFAEAIGLKSDFEADLVPEEMILAYLRNQRSEFSKPNNCGAFLVSF